ncbi:MAG: calcium-binding protein [Allosphingosinicella sp.]
MTIILGTIDGETIGGTSSNDELYGLGGDDSLAGGDGDDLLDGGDGADEMEGGTGDDVYIVDNIADLVVEQSGEGTDEVRTTLSAYALGANVENGFITQSGMNWLWGNGLDNLLQGGSGESWIDADAGDDIVLLSAGRDHVNGGIGTDIFEIAGLSTDYVFLKMSSQVFVREAGASSSDWAAILAGFETLYFDSDSVGIPLATWFDRFGTSGADTLAGDDSDNNLFGYGGDDVLTGGAGNDTLNGGSGADSMAGGIGDDYYIIDDIGDIVSEADGEGWDALEFTSARFDLGNSYVEVIWSLNNSGVTITGGPGDNEIYGGTGHDTILGGGGDDYISADYGNDSIDGGAGADTMRGGYGNDTYYVDSSEDVIIEAADGDQDFALVSTSYFDLGNAWVEQVNYLLTGSVTLIGSPGPNMMTSGTGTDWLEGKDGADYLDGGSGNDHLDGGAGNDELDGGPGSDVMIGGDGNDIYNVDSAGDVVTEAAGEGIDTVKVRMSTYTLGANVENADLRHYSGEMWLTGNSLANIFYMGAGAESVMAGSGIDTASYVSAASAVTIDLANYSTGGAASGDYLNSIENLVGSDYDDTLLGNGGANVIDGGLGADTMTGRAGSDVYSIDNSGDTIVEVGGGGVDEARVSVLSSYTLPNEVEKLTNLTGTTFYGYGNALPNEMNGGAGVDWFYAGDGNDTLNGNDGDDMLFGGDGHDVFHGGAGADTFTGGLGNDIYYVDDTGDTVVELPGEGTDIVYTALAGYTLSANVDNLTFTGSGAFHGVGNSYFNTLTGGGGDDWLEGLGNADELYGNAGCDTLDGGSGDDLLLGGAGADVLTGGAGGDMYRFADGDSGTGSAADRITDFTHWFDKIDLRGVDADSGTAGDQAFSFIGSAAFSNVAGQLRWSFDGTDSWVEGDTNGDGTADFAIVFTGNVPLVSSDFYL